MENDEFFEEFKKHITKVDELANVVLKSHLLVEQDLDEPIAVIFFHPDHVLNAGLNFDRKVQVVRAMSLRTDLVSVWDLLLALNSLRNQVAHRQTDPAGKKRKMDRLRQICLAYVKPESRREHENDPDTTMVVFACAICSGFLRHFIDGYAELRKHINELDQKLHPDEEIVPIRNQE
jgi:hypothetical protein